MTPGPSSKHVLFLVLGTEGYGVQRCWETLVRGLAGRGYRITVVLLNDNPELKARWNGPDVDVVDLPLPLPSPRKGSRLRKGLVLFRRGYDQIRMARRLAAEIRARGISKILVQSPLETVLAALAARLTGARAFWMMPNSVSGDYPFDLNRRLYRAMFRFGRLVPLANSRHTDATLGPGRFRRHVLHLGVDPAAFSADRPRSLERADVGLPPDRPVLGLFARLTEEKGALVLAEAMARAPGDFHVLVCGGPLDGAFARRLRERIAALGLTDRFHFQGPQTDVVPYYALCDVVLNTRLDPEPFGLSVVEAMAMRRPVLAHRAGGPGETVEDGRTGWLIEAPTAEAFAAGIERMLRDRPRWPAMGLAAEAHVRTSFSETLMIDRLEAIMDFEPEKAGGSA